MKIYGDRLQTHVYDIADCGDGQNRLAVIPALDNAGPSTRQLATAFQEVTRLACTDRFKKIYSPEKILPVASEADESLVRRQRWLIENSDHRGQPALEYAVLLEGAGDGFYGHYTPVLGVATGTITDTRILARYRGVEPPIEKQLANISSIFVRPRHVRSSSRVANANDLKNVAPVSGLRAQGRRVGRALLHNLLDAYPNDVKTVVSDFDWKSPVDTILRDVLGFEIVKSELSFIFGSPGIKEITYHGPTVGEVRKKLELFSPSLAQRELL